MKTRHLKTWAISIAVLAVAVAIAWGFDRKSWLVLMPRGATLDIATPLGAFITYMAKEFTLGPIALVDITRALGTLVSQPFTVLAGLLAEGFTFYRAEAPNLHIPALPWIGVAGVFTMLALHYGGRGLAAWTVMTFCYFAGFGLWDSAMVTLAFVIIAVMIGVSLGVVLGILGYRHPRLNAALQPVYDVMQTLPLFSYLVPTILFFGFGPISALIATIVFALPPMARVTTQAMQQVPASVGEFGQMAGCSRRQHTWLVMVPAARRSLLLGINQVIMLSLAVVIIASLIGAGGLGGDVLDALKSVRMGDALASGFAITFMAIMLDRISYAIAMQRLVHGRGTQSWARRHRLLLTCAGILVSSCLISALFPALHRWPEAFTIELGRFGTDAVRWISATFDTQLTGLRDAVIGTVLKPTKVFFLSAPWTSFTLIIALIGWLLGGWRLALLGGAVFTSIAVTGYWKLAMISLYIVLLATLTAMVIGFALGVWAGLSDRANAILITCVDVLQTLPMFVYLIPVVMLFSVGDFPAFLAIVIYAVSPAIRYTTNGLRGVKPSLIEGALMSGCTRSQLLWQVKLPLALPTMLLGLNQVIMMAFGMLVITALIGSRGLEQETLVAIARLRPGSGLLAGLAIAAMAIVLDRYVKAANRKLAYQLGLPVPA